MVTSRTVFKRDGRGVRVQPVNGFKHPHPEMLEKFWHCKNYAMRHASVDALCDDTYTHFATVFEAFQMLRKATRRL